MNIDEQGEILYQCAVKAHNALNIYKFSATTFELNSDLKTFVVLMIDSYYSMYANLSFIFDGSGDAINLERLVRSKQSIAEKDRQTNIKLYLELADKHKTTIKKLNDIRNGAVSHLDRNLLELNLFQNSMDVQILIIDLIQLFKFLKGISIDLDDVLLLDNAAKIRDDLGQSELWNGFILRRMGLI